MWRLLLALAVTLAGCVGAPEGPEPDDPVPVMISQRSYSGANRPPFGPPGPEMAPTEQRFSAGLPMDGCATYTYRLDSPAYVSYSLRATNGSVSITVVNASDAGSFCKEGRGSTWPYMSIDRVEEGRTGTFSDDVVGPVALAFAVRCEEPLVWRADEERPRGPCAFELRVDVDAGKSSGDVVASWDVGPAGRE